MSSHIWSYWQGRLSFTLYNTRGQNNNFYMDIMARWILIYKKVLHKFFKDPKIKWVAFTVNEFFITISVQKQEEKS